MGKYRYSEYTKKLPPGTASRRILAGTFLFCLFFAFGTFRRRLSLRQDICRDGADEILRLRHPVREELLPEILLLVHGVTFFPVTFYHDLQVENGHTARLDSCFPLGTSNPGATCYSSSAPGR